jgi:hypothetical protein
MEILVFCPRFERESKRGAQGKQSPREDKILNRAKPTGLAHQNKFRIKL